MSFRPEPALTRLKLPEVPPMQVISIRLSSGLLNELRAISSETDILYQALIKMFLADAVESGYLTCPL